MIESEDWWVIGVKVGGPVMSSFLRLFLRMAVMDGDSVYRRRSANSNGAP